MNKRKLTRHYKIMKWIADQEKRDNDKIIRYLDTLIEERESQQDSGKKKTLEAK
ncbi:MAG: hypothetical protein PHX40_00350 [Bacilli bacterium]|nr:hypothetical protein [Bacilli bacterium]